MSTNLVKFALLPLGARFKYPDRDGIFVKLENFDCGLVADWQPSLGWRLQGVYSFAESVEQRASVVVEWLDAPDSPAPSDTVLAESSTPRGCMHWAACPIPEVCRPVLEGPCGLRARPDAPDTPQPIGTAPDGVFLVSLSVCPELWWPAHRSDGGPIYSNAHGVLNARDVLQSPRATHWLPMPPAPVST